MSGRPKASVLPEPVRALPHTSRPARTSGIVSTCTGNGSLMPPRPSAAQSLGDTPRLKKLGAALVLGAASVEGMLAPGVGAIAPSTAIREAAALSSFLEVMVSRRVGLRF